MSAWTSLADARESFVAELAELAYPVALRHGARGPSVELELDVWKAIDRVLGDGRRWRRLLEPNAGPHDGRDEVLAEVSDAAYRATLGHGVTGSFLDLELGLWRALDRASWPGDRRGRSGQPRGLGAIRASRQRPYPAPGR